MVALWWARGAERQPRLYVTNGERINEVTPEWRGYYQAVHLAFEDGPEATRAALECIEAQ